MKKLLFLLAFIFIGQQAFSQIYIITLTDDYNINQCDLGNDEMTLSTITPTGVETHICINRKISQGALISLNSEINSIISQGYKLIETNYKSSGLQYGGRLNEGTTFYFAIP